MGRRTFTPEQIINKLREADDDYICELNRKKRA
jgi:hypothetical protein